MVDRLYCEVRPFLLLARACGLLPLYNIKKNVFSQMRLKWISPLTFYWLFIWILSLLIFARRAYYTLTVDRGAANIVVFNRTCPCEIQCLGRTFSQLGPPVLITPAFLYISLNCVSSLEAWDEIESALPPLSPNIRYKLWFIAKVIVIGQMVQHFMRDISGVEIEIQCVKTSLWPAVYLHFFLKYPLLFQGTCVRSNFSLVLSIVYQVIMDLQWASGPLLIITVSRTLSYHLDTLNSTLEHYIDQVMPMKYWQIMRERYNNISRLTRIANHLLHPAILVCCLMETLSIIFLIYMALNFYRMSHGYIGVSAGLVYHTFVNLQLLLSMSAVLELSKRPLMVLTSVPTVVYNEEVSRFYDQVVYGHLALTGGTLFDITRTFMVKVVSTLITYEIVLMQTYAPVINDDAGAGLNNTTPNHDYCVGTIRPIYQLMTRGC